MKSRQDRELTTSAPEADRARKTRRETERRGEDMVDHTARGRGAKVSTEGRALAEYSAEDSERKGMVIAPAAVLEQ